MRRKWMLGRTGGLVATAMAFGAGVLSSSFLGAPAGVPVGFTPVQLPAVAVGPFSSAPPEVVAVPSLGPLPVVVVPALARSPWNPPLSQLLSGELVITTDARMRVVWERLFAEPYDASRFDFGSDFVLWMGGGALQFGSFGISSVERVEASYQDPLTPGGPTTDPFLSATGTTVLPGVPPKDDPPPTYRVSAVRVACSLLDDVVFHRNVLAAP